MEKEIKMHLILIFFFFLCACDIFKVHFKFDLQLDENTANGNWTFMLIKSEVSAFSFLSPNTVPNFNLFYIVSFYNNT